MEVNIKNGDFLQRSFGVRRCWWQMGFLIITSFLLFFNKFIGQVKCTGNSQIKILSFKNIFPKSINKDSLHSYLIEII